MRVLLFTGKGGVGKTTMAAASALRIAASGATVLVCSVDPAHSLADALDHPLDDRPTEIGDGLFGMQLNTRRLLAARWPAIQRWTGALTGSGAELSGVAVEELTVLPGVEELVGLAEVRRLADDGPWDVLVVDCGPTAETLRMLALPEAVGGYLQRVWPRHRRAVVAALGDSGAGLTGAVAALGRLESEAAAVHTLLTDPTRTTVRLVLTPERVVLAEARRTLTALALHGLAVDRVVVNRVVPEMGDTSGVGGPASHWLRGRADEQLAVLASLVVDLPHGVTTTRVPHRMAEPVGIAALAELGDDMYAHEPVVAALGAGTPAGERVALESGLGSDSVYRWRLALPLVEEADVAVDRVDDDLFLSVGGVRRRRRLPSLLTRCEVLDAEVHPGELMVRFRADPTLWMG